MSAVSAVTRLACLAVAVALTATVIAAQGIPGMPGGVLPGTRPAPRIDPNAAVVGTVVSAQDGKPIPKAIVRLSGDRLTQTRVADDKGRFYFRSLPAGSFAITATKTGYFDGAYGQRRAGGTGIPFEVPTATAVQRIAIELFRPAVISGYVEDESNEPLPGVRVVALRREAGGAARFVITDMTTLTDDEGYYRLIGLEPGEYLVAVPNLHMTMPDDVVREYMPDETRLLFDDDGRNVVVDSTMPTRPPAAGGRSFSYPTSYYATVDRASAALPITIAPGEDRTGVNLQLRPVPTARISGVVVGARGLVSLRPLRLVREDDDVVGDGWDVARTLTNASGEFAFLDVPLGRYILESPVGSSDFVNPGDAGSDAAVEWSRNAVEVDERGLRGLIVALRPAIEAHVHITLQTSRGNVNRAALGLPSVVFEEQRGALFRADSSQPGVDDFVIDGLPAGRYDVRVGAPAAGWTVSSIVSGTSNLAEQPLEILDAATPEIEITLTDRVARVAGTVRDARNVPLSAAAVIAFPVSRAAWPNAARTRRAQIVRSSHYGAFDIAGLPPGDYFLAAVDDALTLGWQDPRTFERLANGATRVTLTAGAPRSMELKLIVPAR